MTCRRGHFILSLAPLLLNAKHIARSMGYARLTRASKLNSSLYMPRTKEIGTDGKVRGMHLHTKQHQELHTNHCWTVE